MYYTRRLLIDALAAAEEELQAREDYLSRSRADSPSYQIFRTRARLKAAEVTDLTQALAALEPKDIEPTNYDTLYRFKRGDYIEVTAKSVQDDFGVVRGTALDDRQYFGYAAFRLADTNGNVLTYNLNFVTVKLLHSADIARGVDVLAGD